MSRPLPFTHPEVQAAFSEFTVTIPHVGSGDQKVAYQAERSGTVLALKIRLDKATGNPDEDTEDPAERFRREQRGMASTSSPYVIKAIDPPQLRSIGADEYLWYTEPFLVGGTLRGRLNSAHVLPASAVFHMAECLLHAVDAMWNQGHFVHRDIKPGNIGFDADGNAVVIDLGIVLFEDMTPVTQSSLTSPGTQYYAAPEQYESRRDVQIDFRTDLFQIGIVLFESVTGRHPFKHSANYMHALNSFDPAALDGVAMPDGLRVLISRCLASKPNRRPRTVKMALDMLREV